MEKINIPQNYKSYEQIFNFLMYTDFVNWKKDDKRKLLADIQKEKITNLEMGKNDKWG